MRYPAWIRPGDMIGVTACSAGKTDPVDLRRLESAKEQFLRRGYPVVETPDVRTEEKGRSAPAAQRARELSELVKNPEIKWVVQACGGDFLGEMLSFADFEEISVNPKWHQGYSDPTGLLFTITTNCDLATIYGGNFMEFGMQPWHPSLSENLWLLEGKLKVQNSFAAYQDGFVERVTGYEGFEETVPVYWECGVTPAVLSGRLLGGCLDVLLDLVGTRFDKTASWCEKYKEDGILWYLESFDLKSERLTMGLWHLKEAGWFQYARGFVFGRPCFYGSGTDTSYQEAVWQALSDLGVPVVFEADIGHKPPRMTMINGAKATVTVADGKGKLVLETE